MKYFESFVVTGMMLTVATYDVAAQNTPVDLSQWKPPACVALNQRCYRTIDAETNNRFSNCCTGSNGQVTMTCQGDIWNSKCVNLPNGNSPNNLWPKFDPKGPDAALVNVAQAGTANDSCESVANLGPLLSKSSFTGEFRLLGNTSLTSPVGRESQVGFLVGGNYNAPLAAEIEGNIVVLGNFIVGRNGTNSLGWAGIGSGIFPLEWVFMCVGGNIAGGKADGGETWAMTRGSIQYGGICTSNPANTKVGYPNDRACGSMFVSWDNVAKLEKTTINKAPWEKIFGDLQVKSKYWYSLKPNGVFINTRGGPDKNTMILYAGDSQCLQVFTFDRFDLQTPWNIRMDRSLIGKTILINVSPYDANGNKGPVTINHIGGFFDPWGGNDRSFSSVTKRSMLWNFYGATKVTLGPDSGVQFPGSILIPDGDLDMLWPGQDGRTIVKGDVFHNAKGSEFHNYEFDPPCPLPLPNDFPVPTCNVPSTPRPICETIAPTPAPVTARPTPAPVAPTPAPVTPRPTPAPVAPTRAPVTPRPTPAPVAPTAAPVTPRPTPAPVAPTAAPVTPRPTPAPVAPTAAPVTPRPTPAPVAPTAAPVTPRPTPAPVAPTAAPVTPRPTPAPVALTAAPVAATSAPACTAALVSNVAAAGNNLAWPAGALSVDSNSRAGTVRFNVTQRWKSSDSVSWWNIMEDKNFDGIWDSCVKKDTVPANFISTYEVACRPSGGQVTVQITLHDGSFKNSYNENNSDKACSGWPQGDGIAVYTLTFSCGCAQTPSSPAPVTPRPTLAPVAPTPAPVAATAAPVTPRPTPAPVALTAAPVTPRPTPAPVAPTAAPVTPRPTPAPVAPTAAPVTPRPTPAPVDPTPAPVDPTPAPVGGNVRTTPTVGGGGSIPVGCPNVLGKTGETICPTIGRNIISTMSVRADDNRIIPVGLDPSDLFFDLKFVGTDIAPEVSFKVNNPFGFNVDMMIQHHVRPTGSTRGALDPKCVGRLDEPSCKPISPDVTAGCIRAGSDPPFTLVSIFFISENPLFGEGGTGIEPYKCCPIPTEDVGKPIVEYTFKIECACPSIARHLRSASTPTP